MDHNTQRGVLCVDDNGAVLDALEISFRALAAYEWKGSLSSADDLCSTVKQRNREAATDGSPPVAVVVLDIEMPGKDVFTAAAELVICCPKVAIVFFSGSLTSHKLSRARETSPGSVCVSKDEGMAALLAAIAEQSSATPT